MQSQSRLRRIDSLIGYLFISPQVIGFLTFIIGPVIAIFVLSLFKYNLLVGKYSFIGLENYRVIFTQDPLFWKSVRNTLVFTGGIVPLNIIIALTLSLLLYRQAVGMVFFRTIYFTPVVTSTVAWAIVMTFFLQDKSGTINQFLALFGIHGPNWLYDPNWAMAALIATRSFKNVGLNMIIFLAALQGLPREHVEASMVDGATTLQAVRYIIIPYLASTLLLVTIITVSGALNLFDYILLMTQGGPGNSTMVLAYYVFYSAFKEYEFGYACAIAVVQFLIGVILTVIQWSLRRRLSENEV